MTILKSHVYRKFAHTIINKDFNTLTPQLREEFALCAYSLAGRTCDKFVREWMRSETGFRNAPYELVFEAGDRGKGNLQKRLAQDYKSFPLFKPKKDTSLDDDTVLAGFLPLQAADWFAYEVNLGVLKVTTNPVESQSELRWAMQEFLQYPPGFMGCYSNENLREMEKGIELQKDIVEWEKQIGLSKQAHQK
jgi:hypothetical protein